LGKGSSSSSIKRSSGRHAEKTKYLGSLAHGVLSGSYTTTKKIKAGTEKKDRGVTRDLGKKRKNTTDTKNGMDLT